MSASRFKMLTNLHHKRDHNRPPQKYEKSFTQSICWSIRRVRKICHTVAKLNSNLSINSVDLLQEQLHFDHLSNSLTQTLTIHSQIQPTSFKFNSVFVGLNYSIRGHGKKIISGKVPTNLNAIESSKFKI